MKCPKCDIKTECLDSRWADTKQRRRHECPDCKVRFTTYEMHAKEWKSLRAIREAIRPLLKRKPWKP